MNIITLNAAVLPILTMIFISDSIRDRKSGLYLGFKNRSTALYALGILAVESYFFISDFGVSFMTLLRILAVTAMPFIGAYVFVKYSHKQNYGVEFGQTVKKPEDEN